MSKTYLDRKNPDGPFIFVSYSHADSDAVVKSLSVLNDLGANVWYDTDLRTGDNWLERVKKVVDNKNCAGIIYFVSPDFVFSSACTAEIKLGEELKAERSDFKTFHVLLGDEDPGNFDNFIKDTTTYLFEKYPNRIQEVLPCVSELNSIFNKDDIYRTVSKKKIDSDGFIKVVFKDIFAATGCASDETSKLDSLIGEGLISKDYRLKIDCNIKVSLRKTPVSWKVFSYIGNTISAILVSEEMYAAVCLSVADVALDYVNSLMRVDGNDGNQEKHLEFDRDFIDCLKPDSDGKTVRLLRATEHESYYLQIKEALEMTPVSDPLDDGYFFVRDSQGNIDFADRGSSDVYRHINVDAYASIIPVIDLDYNKYKAYLEKRQKA